jgi:hypothetical protein
MIKTEKESESPARLAEKSYDFKRTLSFLTDRLCGVKVLHDIDFLSCGNCVSWAGRCLRGARYKIAADSPCSEFIPKNQATFSALRVSR